MGEVNDPKNYIFGTDGKPKEVKPPEPLKIITAVYETSCPSCKARKAIQEHEDQMGLERQMAGVAMMSPELDKQWKESDSDVRRGMLVYSVWGWIQGEENKNPLLRINLNDPRFHNDVGLHQVDPEHSVEDALELANGVCSKGYHMRLSSPFVDGDPWWCGFTKKGCSGWNGSPDYHEYGSTMGEAICRAALTVCEREKEA